LLLAIAFEPGARDRLPVLAAALALALSAARKPGAATVAFSFLFPCAGLLTRAFGGSEPLAWPLVLFAGLAAGWAFRFIYDFETPPDASPLDPMLRALTAVWILGGSLAVARAETVWGIRHRVAGRAVNGAGLPSAVAVRESILTVAVLVAGSAFFFLLRRSGAAVRRRALIAALAGIFVSAAAAVLQRAGALAPEARSFWRLTGRLSGGALDPNALGLLCAMGIAVLAAFLLGGGIPRLPAAGALLLLAAGLALSGSRSGLIVPLVGLPAILLRRRAPGRPALAFGGAAALLVVTMLWLAPLAGMAPDRLAQTFDPSLPLRYRVSERPVLWRSAGRLFQRAPVEGGGVGAFSWTLPDLLREENRQLPMRDNPGSAYVQALAETGVVGFALTALFTLLLARHAFACAAAGGGALAAGAAAGILGFLVVQLVGSHWLAPDVCLLFFLLAATVARSDGARVSPASRAALVGSVILYAAAALVAAARTDRPEAAFRHAGLAGFHPAETRNGAAFRWTKGTFGVWIPAGESRLLRLAHYPPDQQPVDVESSASDAPAWRRRLQPGESVLLRLRADPGAPRAVVFRLSRTFVPKRLGISGDRRDLGVVAVLPD